MVLAGTQELWTGCLKLSTILCAKTVNSWNQAMDRMDCVLFREQMKDVECVHLAVDGSKKRKKRYALRASYWSKADGVQKTNVLAAFELPSETAESFVTEILQVLDRNGVPLTKVGHIMGDLANTNIGHVGGIAALMSHKAGRPIMCHVIYIL